MESVASNFTNGVNFAVAGSSAFPRSNPFSLVVQVSQFARFKSRSLEFISRGYIYYVSSIFYYVKKKTYDNNTKRHRFDVVIVHYIAHSANKIFVGIEGLLGDEEFANAVYVIDMGQNDLDTAFASYSYVQVVERIPSWIAEFEYAMWVSNKPELI